MSTPSLEQFPTDGAPKHPDYLNPSAGARPIVARYIRGEFSENELLAALLAYPWVSALPTSAKPFSLEWLAHTSIEGTNPAYPSDLGLWVFKGMVPVRVAEEVGRATGVVLVLTRGPQAAKNEVAIAARRLAGVVSDRQSLAPTSE